MMLLPASARVRHTHQTSFQANQYSRPLNTRVEIDWENPLTRGLVAYLTPMGGGVSRFIRNERPSLGVIRRPYGVAHDVSVSSPVSGLLDGSTMTWVARVYMAADPASWPGSGVSYYATGTDRFHFGLSWNDSMNAIQPTAVKDNGGLNLGGGNYTVTFPYEEHVMVTVSAWGAINCYRGASPTAAVTDTALGTYGNDSRKAFQAGGIPMFYQYLYNRILTNQEDREIIRAPFQIFKPVRSCIWVPVGAAIGGASNAPRFFHRTQAGLA